MSAANIPSVIAAVPIMANPQQPLPLPTTSQQNPRANRGPVRRPLPPHVDLNRMREVERRARREIEIIEENAKAAARSQHPLEPLPRTQSNVRSVKRTRQWRKQVEQILIDKILAKVERNRHLDELIQIELEKSRRIEQEIAQLENLPDVHEDLVQFDEETPEQMMDDLVASIYPQDDSPNPAHPTDNYSPDADFYQTLGNLATSVIDHQLFSGADEEANNCSAEGEPTLNPKYILPPEPYVPDLFGEPFSFDDDNVTR